MKLTVSKRSAKLKSERSLIRHRGDIPAVVYAKGKSNFNISVKGAEFSKLLRSMTPGHLPVTVVELDGEEVKGKAIVKDIHYHPTTYKVLHLDFLLLEGDDSIK